MQHSRTVEPKRAIRSSRYSCMCSRSQVVTSPTASPSTVWMYSPMDLRTMPLYTAIPRMMPTKRADISIPVRAPWCFVGVTACRLVTISVTISPNPSPMVNSENPTPAIPLGIRK